MFAVVKVLAVVQNCFGRSQSFAVVQNFECVCWRWWSKRGHRLRRPSPTAGPAVSNRRPARASPALTEPTRPIPRTGPLYSLVQARNRYPVLLPPDPLRPNRSSASLAYTAPSAARRGAVPAPQRTHHRPVDAKPPSGHVMRSRDLATQSPASPVTSRVGSTRTGRIRVARVPGLRDLPGVTRQSR